jgi:quercetin dioxygenase-like cupin family protein
VAEPISVLLRGQQSDGHLAVIDMVIAANNGGPPLHVHPHHAEGFYVLDGELVVQVGDDVRVARAGSFAFAPPHTPHTFANFSGRDARLLVLCSPAGFEPYFERLAAGEPATPPAGEAIAVGPSLSAPEAPN